jgi:hypothetical protein
MTTSTSDVMHVNIGDGGDPCIPTGAVWSDTKSFTGSKEEVNSKLESIQQSYQNARAEGGRKLRNAKKGPETTSRDLEVADDDNDCATFSGKEHVELVWIPCVFDFEPPDLLEVGPSSVRTYHRLDMPSATDIPPILESRL